MLERRQDRRRKQAAAAALLLKCHTAINNIRTLKREIDEAVNSRSTPEGSEWTVVQTLVGIPDSDITLGADEMILFAEANRIELFNDMLEIANASRIAREVVNAYNELREKIREQAEKFTVFREDEAGRIVGTTNFDINEHPGLHLNMLRASSFIRQLRSLLEKSEAKGLKLGPEISALLAANVKRWRLRASLHQDRPGPRIDS